MLDMVLSLRFAAKGKDRGHHRDGKVAGGRRQDCYNSCGCGGPRNSYNNDGGWRVGAGGGGSSSRDRYSDFTAVVVSEVEAVTTTMIAEYGVGGGVWLTPTATTGAEADEEVTTMTVVEAVLQP